MTLYFKCPECGNIMQTKNLSCPTCRHNDEWKVFDVEHLRYSNCERVLYRALNCPRCGELILPKKYQVYYGQENSENSNNQSGCFITEAVCRSMEHPDNCDELQIFRKFRDDWLKKG